jgi:hypothetical protein
MPVIPVDKKRIMRKMEGRWGKERHPKKELSENFSAESEIHKIDTRST